jgi:hypothetical protein
MGSGEEGEGVGLFIYVSLLKYQIWGCVCTEGVP